MRNRNPKIKKAKFYHRLKYGTFSNSELLRYSLSCFFIGLAFMLFTSKIENVVIENIVGTIGSITILIAYYLFPFIKSQNKEKLAYQLSKFILLIFATIFVSVFWITLCTYNNPDGLFLIVVTIVSILELVLLLLCINYTLKPIFSIFQSVSQYIKKHAEANKENVAITYIKTVLADIGIFISFILSILSFVSTILNYLKPLLNKTIIS